MKKFKHKIVLLDAHAILHRAYHALPDFKTAAGVPTGGLYGLSSMLMKIITDLKPDYLVACYDRAEATFRKQVYDDYKAGRIKADPELIDQIKRSQQIFAAFHIPVYSEASFEADDIVGTIVEKLKNKKDLQIVIASGDMDTTQLVEGERVVVYTLKKGLNDTIVYNERGVVERYGFAPEFLPDYKGLAGDQSDNIIGVKGIGDKTASLLIQKFGTLEEMYKILNKTPKKLEQAGIKPRIIELLKENEEEALFSKTLATIRRDAPIKFELPPNWRETFNPDLAKKLFAELEFRSLVSRLGSLNGDKEEKDSTWRPTSHVSPLASAREHGVTERVMKEIEEPLTPIIREMEKHGVLIDKKYLAKLAKDYHQELESLTKQIYKLAGREFNINSPKQLGEVLYDELKLSTGKPGRKTAGGARTTRESELERLRQMHPIIPIILDYREAEKMRSTYVDALPKLLDEHDRLHSTFNQLGAATGRLSSSNPNLQNIPARGERGEAIRRAFIAPPGKELLAFDYSQIEIRVLAELSSDAELKKIFQTGADVHTSVAARVFKVPPDAVTKDMRRKAKVINFGIIYGMGVTALQANLGTNRAEAKEFYDNYFATFPTIRAYFDKVKKEVAIKGYTETYFGRRRYFPEIKSHLSFLRAAAERMAMNAPLQGTAADIIKLAMIKADADLKKSKLDQDVYLVLQIHDELIYEVNKNKIKEVVAIVKPAMERVVNWSVPIVTGVELGPSWGELKLLN